MFRGLYTATSGMMAMNRQQQVLTNNLANAATPGFKQDETVVRAFPEQLIRAMEAGKMPSGLKPQASTIGSLHTGVYAQEGVPLFTQGALKQTGNATDFALLNDALPAGENGQRPALLFAVRLENGDVRYSQNGQFSVDGSGFLVNAEGRQVMGADLAPLQVGTDDFTADRNGRITRGDGTEAGSLWVGMTGNPQLLVKEGGNLLRWDGAVEEMPASVEGATVQQGMLEQSNVDLMRTMTAMMTTYRVFESNQKIIQAYDSTMEKTVNEIGRV